MTLEQKGFSSPILCMIRGSRPMVRFGVVADHVIHLLGSEPAIQSWSAPLDRANQGDFFIHDQEVVGGPGLIRYP
jgi:hypothetical protein